MTWPTGPWAGLNCSESGLDRESPRPATVERRAGTCHPHRLKPRREMTDPIPTNPFPPRCARASRSRERVTSARRRRQPLDMAGTRLIGVKGESPEFRGSMFHDQRPSKPRATTLRSFSRKRSAVSRARQLRRAHQVLTPTIPSTFSGLPS